MFNIFAERIVKSNFNIDKDVADIETMILSSSRARDSARGVVFFVGELHSSSYDVARRKKLIQKLRGQPNVLIVLEKTFDDDLIFSAFEEENIIAEKTVIVGVNAVRDLSIVEEILDSGKFLTHVVVFFFGQDHEAKMKRFFRQVGAGVGDGLTMRLQEKYLHSVVDRSFSWWTCLPIDEALAQEDDTRLFQNNTEPSGYISDNDSKIDYVLLKKGIIKREFSVEILSATVALATFSRTDGILAVYFGNRERNRRVRVVVKREGSNFVTIRCSDQCKGVLVDRKTLS